MGFIARRNRVALKGQPVLTPARTTNRKDCVPMPVLCAVVLWYKRWINLRILLLIFRASKTAKIHLCATAGNALAMS